MIVRACPVNWFHNVIELLHHFLGHAEACPEKDENRCIFFVDFPAHFTVGDRIRIHTGIGGDDGRLFACLAFDAGNRFFEGGNQFRLFESFFPVHIVLHTAAGLPVVHDAVCHFTLCFHRMHDEIAFNVIRLGRSGNIMKVIVGKSRSDYFHMFVINRIVYQSYIYRCHH